VKGVIRRRDGARRDLIDIFRHYAREAGLRVANRFLVQAEATFERLASMPAMGTRYDPEFSALAELRYFPIARFKNYLVFYRPIEGGIDVARVLHGARDLDVILAEDFGITGDDEDDPQIEGPVR
jgi:toxin ParE1/3/4